MLVTQVYKILFLMITYKSLEKKREKETEATDFHTSWSVIT